MAKAATQGHRDRVSDESMALQATTSAHSGDASIHGVVSARLWPSSLDIARVVEHNDNPSKDSRGEAR